MVQYQQPALDSVFHALADSTRRDILLRLKAGPIGISGLCETYDISLPAVAKHVKVLEDAGLARSHKVGRVRSVEANPEAMRAAANWINHYSNFWSEALGKFAEYLASSDQP